MVFTSKCIHHIRFSVPRLKKNTCSWHFNPRLSLKNVWICSRLGVTNSFAMQISVAFHVIHVAQETQCESKLLSGNVRRNECPDFGNFRSSNTMTKYNSVVQHMKCNNEYEMSQLVPLQIKSNSFLVRQGKVKKVTSKIPLLVA